MTLNDPALLTAHTAGCHRENSDVAVGRYQTASGYLPAEVVAMAMARASVSMVLSSEQQAALEQLEAITASTSQAARDRDERILRQVGWNVQVGRELDSAHAAGRRGADLLIRLGRGRDGACSCRCECVGERKGHRADGGRRLDASATSVIRIWSGRTGSYRIGWARTLENGRLAGELCAWRSMGRMVLLEFVGCALETG